MPITKLVEEVTEKDKVNCISTYGWGDGTVTLYYAGEEDEIPKLQSE